MQPYNGVMPRYEQVQVDTGWVRLEAGGKAILDQRIKTDIEEFWDHYQNKTLPQGLPIRHGAGARRAAHRILAALRHPQARHPHERAGLQPRSR